MARFLLPLVLSACAAASVLPHPPSLKAVEVDGAKHISFPIVERRTLPSLQRRDNVVTAVNHSNVAYLIELDIGTPSSAVSVQIDTGSNELWVNPDCSMVQNKDNRAFCKTLGHYDVNASTTSTDLGVNEDITYGKGSVTIEYYQDNIKVPGSNESTLNQVTFGVAASSDDAAVPILGVGFGNGYNLEYNNFIDELAKQGATNGRAFSLVLGTGAGDDDGKEPVGVNVVNGAIIFGGVDTKKFYGPLQMFTNLEPQDGENLWRYWVQMDSVGYTIRDGMSSKEISDSATPVVLDSGASLSYLPQNVMDGLAVAFAVKEATADGYLVVDCGYGYEGGSLQFAFGALTINVPYSDFIWRVDADTCIVGAQPVSDGLTALLGDTFLRSAYVLFDQDNKNIYLAQAANCGTNEQTLPGGGNYSFTGECTPAKASAASPNAKATQLAVMAAFMATVACFF